ncbi:hypothetical protein Vretimale_1011 [Volvox reticuliferus]|uniref:RNA helicase n=1 Tax=Volvox reticuliferus TaxID=1737510 RepID=A0A8J4CEP4_9CHLO|nr:hypothetical protein Vretifemale_10548 [Volvox reticuliferus]GIL94853.1 hypothetical protein Vretimale_1011 [Volvox reticuliferus]
MSSGRSLQAAARLLRAAGRSAGYSSYDRFARSCLRAAGPFNSTLWIASASQLPQFASKATQPTYGFAAQGVQTVADGCDATSCTGSSEGGSTPACCGTDDAECLSSGDNEGVIPHIPVALPAPPWLTALAQHDHRTSQRGALPFRAHLNLSAVSTAAAETGLSSPSCCTGVHVPRGCRMYGNQAVTRMEDDEELPTRGSSQHPSRPGHAVPLPHFAVTAVEADREEGGECPSAEVYRQHHGIIVEDPERPGSAACIPEPFQKFRDAPFPPAIMDELQSARYGAPSPIQAQAWPIALAGRDLVAIASTGSGKTLGFLLPALLHIQARGGDPALGPTAVVLAPTRELARQIEAEARRFAHVVMNVEAAGSGRQQRSGSSSRFGRHQRGAQRWEVEGGLRTACIYGGAARSVQLEQIRRQPHLVIATPGRLLDFIEAGEIRMKQVSYLVLDEADRMLDMGFEEQIAMVARSMSADRQTLFFSATWPDDVRDAAAAFAKRRAVRLFIGNVQSKPVAAPTITQRVVVVDGADKLDALEAYLKEQLRDNPEGSESEEEGEGEGRRGGRRDVGRRVRRAIVFCETKAGCDHLTHNINSLMPFQAASLHGDKSQAARDFALAKFKAGRVPVLVATDVAARGLDIPHVTCVVNYDMPKDIEMYVHRIGRTGRAGAKGHSLALVNRSRDGGIARSLMEVLEGAGQEVPLELRRLAERSGSRGGYTGQRRGGGWSGQRWGSGGGGGSGGRRRTEGERRYRDRDRELEAEADGLRRHHADGWRSGGGRSHSGGSSRW